MTNRGDQLRRLLQAAAEQYGPPAGQDPARARRRRRLVESATALFIRHGYRKTSVQEVAARAGVAKGTLYLYFPTKADLLLAALFVERRRAFETILEIFDAGLSGRELLRAWFRGMIASLDRSPLTVRLLRGDRELTSVTEDLDPGYVEQVLDLKVSFLAGLIGDACEADARPTDQELRLRARVVIATFNAAGFFSDPQSRLGLDLETLTDALCDVLLEGLCSPGPAHRERKPPREVSVAGALGGRS